MQHIMMVGAGSVGGFFGAQLARHHAGVTFLLRPRTLEAVRRNGLTVRSAGGTFTVRPQAASDPHDLPRPDLIVLAVKTYDLDGVLHQLAPVTTDRTVFLTLQNGVDVEDNILSTIQRDAVVGGVAYIYSKIVEPGVIEHYKRGAVAIGELAGRQSERVARIAEVFKTAGVPCQVSDDIRRTKWEKMCWNCVFNPLTVLINDKVSKALDHPEMLGAIHQIVSEVAGVSAALNVPLAADIADRVLRWSQEIRDIHTSMYDDWKAGRPTEIDSLNGYIVRQGRRLGIPTPLNETLTAMVKVVTERDRTGSGVLQIDGSVIQPITLDRRAMAALPAEHQVEDVGAVQAGVQGKGILLKALLEIPALAIGTDYVTFHSEDGSFSASLPLRQALDHAILVYESHGGPLPAERGGPFRLVTPGLGDLCANVKGLGRIELSKGKGKDTRHAKETWTGGQPRHGS
jgi:2-dehydropantoate 2-reductase